MNKNEGTHGSLLFLVGAYICYMGYKMLDNTRSGLSAMTMKTTVILMCVMMLVGLAVAGYGVYTFIKGWKKQKEFIPDEDDQKEEDS